MATIETAICGLALLMMIVLAGELALYPGTLDGLAQNFFFLWVMFAVMLPFALMAVLLVVWPTAAILGALLWFAATRDRRFAALPLWIAVGMAVGLVLGSMVFIGGVPHFDIVEGPLAPAAALGWTGASGAFAGWRLHRKLDRMGRFEAPAAAG